MKKVIPFRYSAKYLRPALAILLFVVTIFAFVQCTKDTAQPKQDTAPAKKPRDKSGITSLLIANEVNGNPQFVYTQQQMKDAVIQAYNQEEGLAVTISSDLELLSETDSTNTQVVYALVAKAITASGEYYNLFMDVEKNGMTYTLRSGGTMCISIRFCQDCSKNFWGRCKCKSSNSDIAKEDCKKAEDNKPKQIVSSVIAYFLTAEY